MLRILILILIFFLFPFCVKADSFTDEDLQRSAERIKEGNKKALLEIDKLSKDSEFRGQVEEQRELIRGIDSSTLKVDLDMLVNDQYRGQQSKISGELDKYVSSKQLELKQRREEGSLLIFVSLSLPDELLKQYFAVADKIGAGIIFRGFKDNSYLEMRHAITDLGVTSGYQIDPIAAARYDIKTVPSFVLTLESEPPCVKKECPVTKHIKAAGVTSIRSFLEMSKGYGNKSDKEVERWLGNF